MKPLSTLIAPPVHLMNRLKYPQKFLLIGLVLALPLSLLLSQYIAQVDLGIDFAAKEQLGLQYALPLVVFLQDVQKHSGLVDAYPSEGADALTKQQMVIDDDLNAVNAVDDKLGAILGLGTRWTDIKTEWQNVKAKLTILDTATAATVDDNLIHQTLLLVKTIGNNSNLILDPDIDTFYVMDALVNGLPAWTTDLSAIRGYGAAAAAQGKLSPSARTRLIILLGGLQVALEAQHTTFTYISDYNPALLTSLKPAYDATNNEVNGVIDLLKMRILTSVGEQTQATDVTLVPTTYFDIASTAIDSVFSLYSQLAVIGNDLLQTRINAMIGQRNTVVLVCLAALLLVVYLFAGFYVAVRQLVSQFEAGSQRMVTGDMSGKLVLKGHDELAQLVTAFNNVAHEMMTARNQATEANAALRQSETQLRSILDTSPTPLIVVDSQNAVLYINPVALARLGSNWRPLPGLTIADFGLNAEDQARLLEQFERLGYSRDVEVQFHADDSIMRFGRISVQPFEFSGKPALLLAIVDITDLRQAQTAERQHLNLTQALLDSAMALTSTLELDEVVKHILHNVNLVVPHDVANIMIVDGEDALVLGSSDHVPENRDYKLVKARFNYKDNYPGRLMAQTRRPVIIGDIMQDPQFVRIGEGPVLRAYLGIPIIVGQQLIGFISLGCQAADFFTETHANYLQIFGLQAGIAIQNARLYEQAKAIAALEERQHLARELHDSVTQTLFSANALAEALPHVIEQNPQKALHYMRDLHQLTRGAMSEMRSLLVELRPETLTGTDLGVLLSQLCDVFTGNTQVEVVRKINKQIILAPEIQLVFYRVAQEGLNNVAKHAQATQVQVDLSSDNDVVEMRVRDNGRGFDPERIEGNHFGLKFMRERAANIQAEFVVTSPLGGGTQITLKHPNPTLLRSAIKSQPPKS